jgi:hypothetical protein
MVRLRFLLLLLAVLMVLSACGTSDTILPGEQSKENMLAALEEAVGGTITIKAECGGEATFDAENYLYNFISYDRDWTTVFYVIAPKGELEEGEDYKVTGVVSKKKGALEGTGDGITITYNEEVFFIDPVSMEKVPRKEKGTLNH